MSKDPAKVLRHTYTLMKEELVKCDTQVRRKPMFPFATMLDPIFKS